MIDRFLRKLSVSHRIVGGFLVLVLFMAGAIPVVIEDHNYLANRLQHVSEVEARADRYLLLASARIISSRVNFLRYFQDYLPSVSFAVEDINQATDLLIQANNLVIAHEERKAIAVVSKMLTGYTILVKSVQSDGRKGKRSDVARKAFLVLKTGNDITQLIEQIVKDSEKRMTMTIQLAHTEISRRLLVIVLGFVGVLVLSLLLAIFLARSITRPVADLRKGAEEFGLGKMATKIPTFGKDELSLLANTFNTIDEQLQTSFSTLQRSEEELRKHRDHLEELVEERTKEISKTNEQLRLEIAERARTEEALRESEERYRSLYSSMNEGVCLHEIIYDRSGIAVDYQITDVNSSYESIMGFSRQEAIGSKASELYGTGEAPFLSAYAKVVETGEPANFETFWSPLEKHLRISVFSPGKDKFAAVFSDITKHHQLQAQLQQVQKLESIGILAGGLAHDFNNLLAIIAGNIDLAKYDLKPEAHVYQYLEEAGNASLRAKELTKQLITFSKGGTPFKAVGLIGGLVEDTTNLTIEQSNVTCDLSIAGDLWPVEFDESQMKHALKNLIDNAVEAMPDGGSIHVMTENFEIDSKAKQTALPFSEGKYVKISIQDQGVGIPQENISTIFDPYFSTKEMGVQKGMGLGLSIAYSIIKKHAGYITVESEVDAGTLVNVYLPIHVKIISERELREPPKPEKPEVRTGKILVMDDEEMIRKLSGQLLSRLGYESEVAQDGIEAVELYEKAKNAGNVFDVVILDLSVKIGMGGKDAVKKLIEGDPEVKAIVSSGYSDDPVMSNFGDYGFTGALAKPYEMKDLDDIIKKVMMD
ncbi:MAG: response regulator [Deltaproteobacteria bacterium]|nr:response regulator [Deltaproteobacteria bacterium]